MNGYLRVDDPNRGPPRASVRTSSKTCGAVERADFFRPNSSVYVTDVQNIDILDNDLAARDRNRLVDDMATATRT